MNNGYCLAYRKAWSHPAFKDLREAAIWNYLYQNAAYEPCEALLNGYTFQLERGQIAVSVSYLAKGFSMTEKGVRVVIQKLEKLGMLGKQGTSRGSIITICNYDIYQLKEKAEGEPKGNKGANRGQAEGDNINKRKKEDKINEEIKLTIGDFDLFWKAYGKIGNKQQALKSFNKAIKEGVKYETIRRGLDHYQTYCRAIRQEQKYIKHASTWLNNRGWEDEYTIHQQAESNYSQELYKLALQGID